MCLWCVSFAAPVVWTTQSFKAFPAQPPAEDDLSHRHSQLSLCQILQARELPNLEHKGHGAMISLQTLPGRHDTGLSPSDSFIISHPLWSPSRAFPPLARRRCPSKLSENLCRTRSSFSTKRARQASFIRILCSCRVFSVLGQ